MQPQMVPTEPRAQADAAPGSGDAANAVQQKIQDLITKQLPSILQTVIQVVAKINPDGAKQVMQSADELLKGTMGALGLGPAQPAEDEGEEGDQGSQGSQPVDAMGGAKGVPVA